MGRFTQEDTAKDGLNWYSYTGGNPVLFIDPTGFIPECVELDETIIDTNWLLNCLINAVGTYASFFQRIATIPYNTEAEVLNIVLKYDKTISEAAEKYEIDKAMIQAILFQEIRFYNIGDEIDGAVLQTYEYLEKTVEFYSLPWYLKLLVGAPIPPAVFRLDSSTGLGQIFAATAIEAINWYKGSNVYDVENWEDTEFIWKKLKNDDEFNIEMVALVLAHKQALLKEQGITNPTPQQIMQAYNGSGKLAVAYGIVTYLYYCAFFTYNSRH